MKPSLAFELSISQLERGVNHALQYSLQWPEYADRLNNIVLQCELSPLNIQVFVRIENQHISMSTQGPERVDLIIIATPSALLELAEKKRAGSNITISGNAALAQTLQHAMSNLDVDWEGLLAEHMGDMTARQTATFFGKLKDFATRFANTLISDTADYFVDEQQLLPAKNEVDAFYKEITALRYDADRLEARIRRLERN